MRIGVSGGAMTTIGFQVFTGRRPTTHKGEALFLLQLGGPAESTSFVETAVCCQTHLFC
jgi:hypothetical protein